MEIRWYGTAAIEVRSGSEQILFDPFIPLEGADKVIDISEFDGFSDILVTHGHFDHIIDLPEITKRNPQVMIHCTKTPYNTLLKCGVPEENLTEIRMGETLSIRGFEIDVVHSKHAELPITVKRFMHMLTSPFRKNLGLIARAFRDYPENDEIVAFVVRAEDRSVMIMGSLNLRDNIEYMVGPDVLVLPYNGWKDPYSIAIKTIERIKPKRIVLDHYDDTFPPLTMPYDLAPIIAYDAAHISALEIGRIETV